MEASLCSNLMVLSNALVDVPDVQSASYKQFLHWMVYVLTACLWKLTHITLFCRPNIPISATQPGRFVSLALPPASSHPVPYIPPHPQNGTKYHRYVTFLLPNPSPTEAVDIPSYTFEERRSFILREFLSANGFDPASGGGAHIWRALWTPTVSDIYKDVLSKFSIDYHSRLQG